MRSVIWTGIGILLGTGLCMPIPCGAAAPASAAAGVQGALYYAGESVNLSGTTLATGADLKSNTISSTGSRAGLHWMWGPRWYQSLGVDVHSTSSLVPTELGVDEANQDIALSSLQAVMGNSSGLLPSLAYDRMAFSAVAVATGSYPIYKDGTLLARGDEFTMSITRQLFLLSWKYTSDGRPLELSASGGGFFLGIGMARIDFVGLQKSDYANVSSVDTLFTSGPAVSLKLRYGALPVAHATRLYAQANGEVAAARYAGIVQAGYELGLIYNSGGLLLRPYVGGYFWQISSWTTSIGFKGLETSGGWVGGLQLEKIW